MSAFLAGLDARIFFAIYAAGGGALTRFAEVLSALGNGWIMLGLIPLSALPRYRRFALTLTLTLAASAGLVALLKVAVGRTRPCALLPGVTALCATPTDPSFPSGHACGSFTLVAFVVLAMNTGEPRRSPVTRGLMAATLVTLAIAIAWSRVYLGVHFPSDVTAGALLGASCGALSGRRYAQPRSAPQ